MDLPLLGGGVYTPAPGLLEMTADAFPCDVGKEIKNLRLWLLAKPERQRDAERMPWLIGRWFKNAHEDGLRKEAPARSVWQEGMINSQQMLEAALAAGDPFANEGIKIGSAE